MKIELDYVKVGDYYLPDLTIRLTAVWASMACCGCGI